MKKLPKPTHNQTTHVAWATGVRAGGWNSAFGAAAAAAAGPGPSDVSSWGCSPHDMDVDQKLLGTLMGGLEVFCPSSPYAALRDFFMF